MLRCRCWNIWNIYCGHKDRLNSIYSARKNNSTLKYGYGKFIKSYFEKLFLFVIN